MRPSRCRNRHESRTISTAAGRVKMGSQATTVEVRKCGWRDSPKRWRERVMFCSTSTRQSLGVVSSQAGAWDGGGAVTRRKLHQLPNRLRSRFHQILRPSAEVELAGVEGEAGFGVERGEDFL